MTLSREQLAQAQVLVVGDVMLDRYWYGAVDRISPEAPVPVVRVTREENRLGGCANVAYNVVSLGAHASLLSVVGDDEASHLLEDLVAQTGIAPYLGRDAQLKTTVKLRVIGRQQQLLRIDFENTPQTEVLASQSAQFTRLLPDHAVVLFSDYGKGGLAHVSQMIGAARDQFLEKRHDRPPRAHHIAVAHHGKVGRMVAGDVVGGRPLGGGGSRRSCLAFPAGAGRARPPPTRKRIGGRRRRTGGFSWCRGRR